jgi:hypothetical protein
MFETIQTKEYGEVRFLWIRLVYIASAFIGISSGLCILIAPRFSNRLVGFPSILPHTDPVVFGLVGGTWAGVGVLCLLGLRSPLKFLPLLAFQFVYKCLWFAFVFLPLIRDGEFPRYGWCIACGNLLWILLDLKAIPSRYIFSPDLPVTVLPSTSSTVINKRNAVEKSRNCSPA